MPSADTLLYFPKHMRVLQHWRNNGVHYGLTAEAWLQNMDSNRVEIEEIFAACYPAGEVGS